MSFIAGKISRKMGKEHKEYFVGKVCGFPVRASWAKDNQDLLWIFLDEDIVKYLSQKNQDANEAAEVKEETQVKEEPKQ